ncbi:hypothetical protein SCA6_000703 [Theobroma cacao]
MGKMASEALFVVVVVAAAAAVVLANALPVKSERGGVEKDEVNIWPMSAWRGAAMGMRLGYSKTHSTECLLSSNWIMLLMPIFLHCMINLCSRVCV